MGGDRRAWPWLLGLGLLILASRLAVLFVSTKFPVDHEELARGLLALHLDRGLLLPLHEYQFEEYSGGSVVMGLLVALPFALFGRTLFALRLAPLIFSLALFAILFLGADRRFDRTAARVLGVLFLFAPSYYVLSSLQAQGGHAEAGALLAAILFLFAAAKQPAESRFAQRVGSRGTHALLGLVSGLAVYFQYDALILLALLTVVHIAAARSGRAALSSGLWFAAGFLVGFSPWLVFHAGESPLGYFARFYRSAGVPGERVGSFNDPGLFLRAVTVRFATLPGSHPLALGSRVIVPAWLFDAAVTVSFLASYIFLAARHRRALADLFLRFRRGSAVIWSSGHLVAVILAYVPLHLVVFALYRPQGVQPIPPQRYLLGLFPFLFLVTATGVGGMWDAGRKRAAAVILALAVLGGVGGNVGLFTDPEPGTALQQRGYSHRYLQQILAHRYRFRVAEDVVWRYGIATYPGRVEEFMAGVAAGVAYLGGASIEGHLRAAETDGPDALAAFAAGLGVATQITRPANLALVRTLPEILPPGMRGAFDAGAAAGRSLAETGGSPAPAGRPASMS